MTTTLEATRQVEQKVILHDVSWETYERLLREQQASSSTRFTYDQATLEIMLLSLRHERLRQTLATLVEILAAELQRDNTGAARPLSGAQTSRAASSLRLVSTSPTPNGCGRKTRSI